MPQIATPQRIILITQRVVAGLVDIVCALIAAQVVSVPANAGGCCGRESGVVDAERAAMDEATTKMILNTRGRVAREELDAIAARHGIRADYLADMMRQAFPGQVDTAERRYQAATQSVADHIRENCMITIGQIENLGSAHGCTDIRELLNSARDRFPYKVFERSPFEAMGSRPAPRNDSASQDQQRYSPTGAAPSQHNFADGDAAGPDPNFIPDPEQQNPRQRPNRVRPEALGTALTNLGLAPNAQPQRDEVDRAFRRGWLPLHPDTNFGASEDRLRAQREQSDRLTADRDCIYRAYGWDRPQPPSG